MAAGDQRLEMAMGRMLQIGVTIAALVVLAGGVLSLGSGAAHVTGLPTLPRRTTNKDAFGLHYDGGVLSERQRSHRIRYPAPDCDPHLPRPVRPGGIRLDERPALYGGERSGVCDPAVQSLLAPLIRGPVLDSSETTRLLPARRKLFPPQKAAIGMRHVWVNWPRSPPPHFFPIAFLLICRISGTSRTGNTGLGNAIQWVTCTQIHCGGIMAERQDQRSENQPSHDAQVKGGQHSQSGSGSRAGETQNSGTQNTGTEKIGHPKLG